MDIELKILNFSRDDLGPMIRDVRQALLEPSTQSTQQAELVEQLQQLYLQAQTAAQLKSAAPESVTFVDEFSDRSSIASSKSITPAPTQVPALPSTEIKQAVAQPPDASTPSKNIHHQPFTPTEAAPSQTKLDRLLSNNYVFVGALILMLLIGYFGFTRQNPFSWVPGLLQSAPTKSN